MFVRKRLIGTALGLFALCAGGFASANAEEFVLQNGANGYNKCFDTHFEEGQGSRSATEEELVVGDNCPGG